MGCRNDSRKLFPLWAVVVEPCRRNLSTVLRTGTLISLLLPTLVECAPKGINSPCSWGASIALEKDLRWKSTPWDLLTVHHSWDEIRGGPRGGTQACVGQEGKECLSNKNPQTYIWWNNMQFPVQCYINVFWGFLLVKYFIALRVEINMSRITWNEPTIQATWRAFRSATSN